MLPVERKRKPKMLVVSVPSDSQERTCYDHGVFRYRDLSEALGVGRVRVKQGELVWVEAEGICAHRESLLH